MFLIFAFIVSELAGRDSQSEALTNAVQVVRKKINSALDENGGLRWTFAKLIFEKQILMIE